MQNTGAKISLRKTVLLLALFSVLLSMPAYAEPLRVDGKALEDVLTLPSGTGNAAFRHNPTIYIGNLPKGAAQFDSRAAHGRLDRGEVGAYLAHLISEKPVTGTASPRQTLLLMRYAMSGGGHVGAKAKRIKDVLKIIQVEIERNCFFPPTCGN